MDWSLEVADSTANGGREPSLAFGSDGIPHIAHHEQSNGSTESVLRYAAKQGGAWHSETVDDTDLVGEEPSLRVGLSGRVHIAYAPQSPILTVPPGQPVPEPAIKDLRYAVLEAGNWSRTVVPSPTFVWAAYPCLALDPEDHPHISYSDWEHSDLYYAHWDGNSWHSELVDSEGSLYSAIVVDSAGNPHILYARYAPAFLDLYHAWRVGAGWAFEKVGDAGFIVANLAMEIDAQDRLHVVWTDRNQGLMYAVHDANWTAESLGFPYGGPVGIALLGTAPRIVYSYASLYYGTRDGGAWSWEIVNTSAQVGIGLSSGRRLAVDPGGAPHIAATHRAGNYSDLAYLSRAPASQLPEGDVVMSTDRSCYRPGEDIHITATGWATVPDIGDFPYIFWAITNASGAPVFETRNYATAIGGFNGTLDGVWNQTYRLFGGGPTGPVPAGGYTIWFYELAPPGKTPPTWAVPAEIEIGDCGGELSAEIDFDPNTLNPRSQGKWVTVYIELTEDIDPRDINATTIRLNDTLPPVLDPKYGFVTDPAGYITDHDGDGIEERMVKFDRAAVIALLAPGTYPVRITGRLADGTPFAGWSDPVRVMDARP